MESQSLHKSKLAHHTLRQMVEACEMILKWNSHTLSVEDYVDSSSGMQRLAASCMLIESLGEGVKKIDKLLSDFLNSNAPQIPWVEKFGIIMLFIYIY